MSSCDFITSLKPNEVLVFGSNLAGMHEVFRRGIRRGEHLTAR